MIISDTTIRTLMVKGIEEVKRIKHLNKDEHILNVTQESRDIYKVELIYRVGDYFRKGGE